MLGNLHVRFGAGDEETCPGNGVRRFIPTLPEPPTPLSLSRPRHPDCRPATAAPARMPPGTGRSGQIKVGQASTGVLFLMRIA